MYPNLPQCTPIYLNLLQFASIYLDLPQFISIYLDLPQFTLTYPNFPISSFRPSVRQSVSQSRWSVQEMLAHLKNALYLHLKTIR